jgi:hypothetical protein
MAPLKFASLMLAAWRGDEVEGPGAVRGWEDRATARGEGMGLGALEWATALLYNGHGRYTEALAGRPARAAKRTTAGSSPGPS